MLAVAIPISTPSANGVISQPQIITGNGYMLPIPTSTPNPIPAPNQSADSAVILMSCIYGQIINHSQDGKLRLPLLSDTIEELHPEDII